MKKAVMILFAVAVAAVTKAQETNQSPPKKTPEERATNMTAHMTKALSLNAEQQQKVKELILKREKEREEMMARTKGSREEIERKMEADLQKVLSPEQFEKFKKKKEEMKKHREEKRTNPEEDDLPPPPPAPEK
jgi:periplasmic protein CpxP/Spy